ncbi:hypothetical protein [Pseudomonas sp.]|uniref:hypothetical protein n=1 Tax=Pseudomonas sp. TaxID=306 RepID=UPI0019DCA596|nr:hypothetical protein [Pseudomonas sp.]MBF0675103.1 hypothetical protein [Pseudomonas sp.]MBF0677015.1 hypothetical protein [Pseudomonas sp.]
MPLKNRVDPHSQLHAVSARGIFMGNRGRLHNTERQIVRQWKGHPWITCALSFKDYQRPAMMMPNSYTELFFLDEPTAYAAGHPPLRGMPPPGLQAVQGSLGAGLPRAAGPIGQGPRQPAARRPPKR